MFLSNFFLMQAPESYTQYKVGPPADIWQFGLLLHALCSRPDAILFDQIDYTGSEQLAKQGKLSQRFVNLKSDCPAALQSLARLVFVESPSARPTAAALISQVYSEFRIFAFTDLHMRVMQSFSPTSQLWPRKLSLPRQAPFRMFWKLFQSCVQFSTTSSTIQRTNSIAVLPSRRSVCSLCLCHGTCTMQLNAKFVGVNGAMEFLTGVGFKPTPDGQLTLQSQNYPPSVLVRARDLTFLNPVSTERFSSRRPGVARPIATNSDSCMISVLSFCVARDLVQMNH